MSAVLFLGRNIAVVSKTLNLIRGKSDDGGFTIIEVLLALAIFSIGILAVGGMQIRSINENAAARIQSEETTVAADWLERLMKLPYDHDMLEPSGNPHQVIEGTYRVSWSVAEDDPINNVKTIALSVTSANRNGKRVRLNFMKAQEG
jgi:prepilin-type N-terminal cleavage/methylation domain-containing protein